MNKRHVIIVIVFSINIAGCTPLIVEEISEGVTKGVIEEIEEHHHQESNSSDVSK